VQAYFFYGEMNGGYLEGSALSNFDALTDINLHFIRVSIKEK